VVRTRAHDLHIDICDTGGECVYADPI
jgi:hypothetical protein